MFAFDLGIAYDSDSAQRCMCKSLVFRHLDIKAPKGLSAATVYSFEWIFKHSHFSLL